jgi:FkbM family methyltransferase
MTLRNRLAQIRNIFAGGLLKALGLPPRKVLNNLRYVGYLPFWAADRDVICRYRFNGHVLFYSCDLFSQEAVSEMVGNIFRVNANGRGEPYDFSHVVFEDGDVIVDVGGHIGTLGIFLAKLHPNVKVYIFEPVTKLYRYITKNIELNGLTNVVAINKAVTKHGARLQIVMPELNSVIGSGLTDIIDNYDRYSMGDERNWAVIVEEADGIDFNDFIEQEGIQQIRALKMNCEGGEYDIFYNLRDAHWAKIRHLNMDLHGTRESQEKLMALLTEKLGKENCIFNEYHPT